MTYLRVSWVAMSLPADQSRQNERDESDYGCADHAHLSEHGETSEPAHDSPVTVVVMMVVGSSVVAVLPFVHVASFVGESGVDCAIWWKRIQGIEGVVPKERN